jgi:hypothetical protein
VHPAVQFRVAFFVVLIREDFHHLAVLLAPVYAQDAQDAQGELVQELIREVLQACQLTVFVQQQFSFVRHGGLVLDRHPIFLQLHEDHAQDDLHPDLEDSDDQEFVVHGEQYDDHGEHHQHSLSVDQYLIFD